MKKFYNRSSCYEAEYAYIFFTGKSRQMSGAERVEEGDNKELR